MKNTLQWSLALGQSTTALKESVEKQPPAAPICSPAPTCVVAAPEGPCFRPGQRLSPAVGLFRLQKRRNTSSHQRCLKCWAVVLQHWRPRLFSIWRKFGRWQCKAPFQLCPLSGQTYEVPGTLIFQKGGRLCALSCSKLFFLLKVCMLTLLPWTRPVAPFSCLSPDEVGKEGVRKWQVLVGLSADMGLLAETHSGLAGKASVGISLGEKKHSESLHILLYCQPGSYRPLLPSWLTCAHLHHSILIPATMVHLTACLLHHPYPRGLDQSCERIWENWEQDCSLAPVLQGHWLLASVLLLLGDKLTVSVEIASRTTNLLTPSIPKCFTCSPPHQNTASSIRTRSSSQRANDLLQKNKVKNCH